jgi:ABC-type glycerol-3-phosphate transport system permease component
MMAQQKGFAVGCFVAGILATPIATLLAFMSAGAGHGGYEFARLFFPYSMLLTLIADDTITIPLIVLALAQFSIYGLLLGGTALVGRWPFWITLIGIGIIHFAAVAACFSGLLPNFS